METLRKNLGLSQIEKELALLFAPGEVEIISLKKALREKNITDEEFSFLNQNEYKYLMIGETTVFASRVGDLFTEFQVEE